MKNRDSGYDPTPTTIMDASIDEPRASSNIDLPELINQLKKEKLWVHAEKIYIQALNERLVKDTEAFLQIAWINFQHRINLNTLVGVKAESTPEQCTRKAHLIASSIFVDAKTVLEYQVLINYSTFLSNLRLRPDLVAQWLVIGEGLAQDQKAYGNMLHSLVTGLFGSLLLPQDVRLMMTLLQSLAKLQLATTDNPRRLLKHRICAFSRLYFLFHEGLTSAKLFLIAALQGPILKLIAMSDCCLDIDPSKSLLRLTQAERDERFGKEGSDEYSNKIAHFKSTSAKKLSQLAKLFISSLQDNAYCFPSSLAWLIRQVASMIAKSFSPNSKEINAITTDLVFTLFICPAIIQPEPYGICDAPISEVARHNLIQVGTIIQMLALMKFERPETKLMELYKLFESDCISNLLDTILNDDVCESIPIDNVPGISRNVALFTETELYDLVSFLRKVQNSIAIDSEQDSDPVVVLVNKLPTSNESSPRNTLATSSNNVSPTRFKSSQLLNRARQHILKQTNNGDAMENESMTVLIIPLQSEEEVEHIGLLQEDKVIAMEENIAVDAMLIDVDDTDASNHDPVPINGPIEKRTRFSHHDEGSIGNTSDNLEVISEAASNHSVASSIEMETEDQNDNDNLSDMVSANVSGRGSPNISGRDTPSSQVTENEDNNRPLVEVRPFLVQPQPRLKQIRSEIDDKFCKFEIKKLLEGDETISIISDTWSTDVLASDSETIEACERHAEIVAPPLVDQPNLDVAETHSESAWSTDVLTSDTERLTEVDNDDIASVAPSDARSDDAASVAPSERSEIDENMDRRLSTASGNHFGAFQSSQNSPSAFQDYHQHQQQEIAAARREAMPSYKQDLQETAFYDRSISYSSSTVENNCILRPISLNCAEANKRDAIIVDKAIDMKRAILSDISNCPSNLTIDAPGPSRIKSEPSSSAYMLVKNAEQKYEDVKTEIQRSNTSLNSSSSGSSNSSEAQKNEKWKSKLWLNNNGDCSDRGGVSEKPAHQKPSPSTGAIPKSISFDMSAEKGDKEMDDDARHKRGGSFFGKFKVNFRHRRGKSFRVGASDGECSNGFRMAYEDDSRRAIDCLGMSMKSLEDVTEGILAKYRSKPTQNGVADASNDRSNKMVKGDGLEQDLRQDVNGNSLLHDAKKKLRWVLSHSRTHYIKNNKDGRKHIKKELESFLQIELAKARDLRQFSCAARVAEALRCLRLLDIASFNKLCDHLQEELARRSIYIKYLFRSKQSLLSSESYLKELGDQVLRDKELSLSFLVEVSVRHFLEKQHAELQQFCDEFKKPSPIDEKNHLLEEFLHQLFALIKRDALWQDASEAQMKMTQDALERSIMMEVYHYALYPNGDGDRHRDSVLASHLNKLASTITPGNKYLMISKVHQNECPWLPAQEALHGMAAYRTPRDKVACVTRCAFAIMDLLALAQGSSATADDLIPVLVYVIIQVNPQDLLSTIQYVNSFYANLSGEDYFYWTQFCSAVEFTKTMEYTD